VFQNPPKGDLTPEGRGLSRRGPPKRAPSRATGKRRPWKTMPRPPNLRDLRVGGDARKGTQRVHRQCEDSLSENPRRGRGFPFPGEKGFLQGGGARCPRLKRSGDPRRLGGHPPLTSIVGPFSLFRLPGAVFPVQHPLPAFFFFFKHPFYTGTFARSEHFCSSLFPFFVVRDPPSVSFFPHVPYPFV